MSIAKKCDICGSFYEPYNETKHKEKVNGFMLLNIDSVQKYFSHNMHDCCPRCMQAILDHIDSLKTKE